MSMSLAPAYRGRRRQALGVLVGVALFVSVLFAPESEMTEAAFTDSEHATAALQADSLVTPVITSCTVQTFLGFGVIFTGVTIVWTSPYPASSVELRINGVLIPGVNIAQSGSGPYTYTATLTANLLQLILGGLLGSSNSVTVRAIYPESSWVSSAATRTLNIGGVFGLIGGNTCTAP